MDKVFTFFFIKHALGSLLMLPAINLLLIAIGTLLLPFFQVAGKILIVSAVVLLWLFSTPIIAQHFITSLQNRYPALSIVKFKPKKNAAIVVLEAGLNYTKPEYGDKPMVSTNTLARLRYAAFLYRKTGVPILVSGNDPYHPHINQAKYMTRALKTYFNVPVRWEENRGYDTDSEATYSVAMLKKSGIKEIYLVTHAFHMSRSVGVFQNRGVAIIPAPTDFKNLESSYGIINFIPCVSALDESNLALHEYFGMIWYQLCTFFHI